MSIFGAIAGATNVGNNIRLTNVNNIQLVFDKGLSPPYFAGGGTEITIDNWKGHSQN